MKSTLKVASVNFALKPFADFSAFAENVKSYLDKTSAHGAELTVFPEYLTTCLLTAEPYADISELENFTEIYTDFFTQESKRRNTIIVAGTHISESKNTAYIFMPDGKVITQPKIHLTPWERENWNLSDGDKLEIIDIGVCKIAVLICYDVEFPELARIARSKGADILIVPSATDDELGATRISICAAARAIENQVFVVTSAILGNLPLTGMETNVGRGTIFCPSDIPFNNNGIIAEGKFNSPEPLFAELDLSALEFSRQNGAVKTWQDRKPELYSNL